LGHKDVKTTMIYTHVLNREKLYKQKPESSPAFIFTRINADTFQKESGKTQEFIFYPEMNKCIPETENKNKEASNKAIDSDKK